MKTGEKWVKVFFYKGFPVEISNLSIEEDQKSFPEYSMDFLYEKIKKAIDQFSTEDYLEKNYGETAIVEVKGTNIKFGLEIRTDESSFHCIVFDLLDKSKYTYLSHEEKLEEVKSICKEKGYKLNEVYHRFDPEPGFEDWGFGFSFCQDGEIFDCFETIVID